MANQVESPSPNNYTIAGSRMDFSELLDDTLTPNQYLGFISLGNVVSSPFAMDLTNIEHFTTQSGRRALDRKVSTELKPAFTITLDELNVRNIALLLRSTAGLVVAASTGNVVTDESMRLDLEETRSLELGFDQVAIVVTDLTGVTTYVLDTDYTVETFLSTGGGNTILGIARIAAGAIADGEQVLVDYTYDILDHQEIKPGTKLEVKGKIRFAMVSDTGNEAYYRHVKVIVTPSGEMSPNSEDWTTMDLEILFEEDTTTPTFPYGKWEHYGTGVNL